MPAYIPISPVAELRPGVVTEIEVGRVERDEQVDLADLWTSAALDEAVDRGASGQDRPGGGS